jgi:hypothetical protein
MLKLWGRALARMKINEPAKTIYSVLAAADFERAESSAKDLLPALAEFVDNLSDYKIIALLAETGKNEVKFLAAVHAYVAPENLAVKFGGKILNLSLGNYKIIERDFSDSSLENIEKIFLDSIAELQKTSKL